MPTKRAPSPLASYVGQYYTAPDGGVWRVVTAFKNHVRAHKASSRGSGNGSKVTLEQLQTWRKHEAPTVVKVGDVFMATDGYPCIVSGFASMGDVRFMNVVSTWGFPETDHLHENALPLYRNCIINEGLRLPFEDEKDIVQRFLDTKPLERLYAKSCASEEAVAAK